MNVTVDMLPVRPIPIGEQVMTEDNEGRMVEITHLAARHASHLNRVRVAPGATAWGYAIDMTYVAHEGDYYHVVQPGQVFEIDGPASIESVSAFVVVQHKYSGLYTVKGPIERAGRLRYIDGCSDTLLLGPHRKGDACLNHLHFPGGIKQTRHTHPSLRAGVIARGSGAAFNGDENCVVHLERGMVWWMPPGTDHGFMTESLATMDVVAWHPDSDTGPSDEDHPMLNRTMVDGISARHCDEIRTQVIRA